VPTINVRLALQGGGALGAYGAGVLIALLENPRINISEASGTSAGAGNIFLANQNDRERAIHSIKSYWSQIGQVGQAMKIIELMNPIGSYLFQSWNAVAGIKDSNPLRYLNKLLKGLVPEHHRGDIQTRVNTVSKYDQKGPLSSKNLREHTHEAHLDAVTASGALNALGSWNIDGLEHWDGVYSGKNPNLELFDRQSTDPLIVVSVDNKEITVSPQDPQISYGMIHGEVDDFRTNSAANVYHISLADRQKVDDRQRLYPTPDRVSGLLQKGYEDGVACLGKLIQNHGLRIVRTPPREILTLKARLM
jgi:predicted acylesterase/phospholipase RssA